MPMRPADSAPKLVDGAPRPDLDDAPKAGPPQPGDDDFSESHVLHMPAMVPHLSDGNTEILEKGRDPAEDRIPSDATEPLFPRHAAMAPVVAQDAGQHNADDDQPDAPTVKFRHDDPDETDSVGRTGEFSPVAAPTDSSAEPRIAPFTPVEAPVPQPAATPAAAAPRSGSLAVVLLLSYASAVTIALIYLIANRQPQPDLRHQLEDLRDPVDEEGTVRIYQREADLPPGHTLTLSSGQRFGNILVEPLRVSRGPLEMRHYTRDRRKTKPDSPPVYKLWLRLTNVSDDQQIAPLDSLLMFKRGLNQEGQLVSNTFVTQADDDGAGPIVLAYPAAQNSEWDIVGLELGRKLEPGESIETFIPSDHEGLDQLQGELVWRFQLRKGYAPTGRGVTTLVEVQFSAEDVQPDPTAPATTAAAARGTATAGSPS